MMLDYFIDMLMFSSLISHDTLIADAAASRRRHRYIASAAAIYAMPPPCFFMLPVFIYYITIFRYAAMLISSRY